MRALELRRQQVLQRFLGGLGTTLAVAVVLGAAFTRQDQQRNNTGGGDHQGADDEAHVLIRLAQEQRAQELAHRSAQRGRAQAGGQCAAHGLRHAIGEDGEHRRLDSALAQVVQHVAGGQAWNVAEGAQQIQADAGHDGTSEDPRRTLAEAGTRVIGECAPDVAGEQTDDCGQRGDGAECGGGFGFAVADVPQVLRHQGVAVQYECSAVKDGEDDEGHKIPGCGGLGKRLPCFRG